VPLLKKSRRLNASFGLRGLRPSLFLAMSFTPYGPCRSATRPSWGAIALLRRGVRGWRNALRLLRPTSLVLAQS
jgi:hypothetical protein